MCSKVSTRAIINLKDYPEAGFPGWDINQVIEPCPRSTKAYHSAPSISSLLFIQARLKKKHYEKVRLVYPRLKIVSRGLHGIAITYIIMDSSKAQSYRSNS